MLYLFYKKGCGSCNSVKNQLVSRGIVFEIIDVGTSKGWEKAKALNISIVGTVIDENDTIVDLKQLLV